MKTEFSIRMAEELVDALMKEQRALVASDEALNEIERELATLPIESHRLSSGPR